MKKILFFASVLVLGASMFGAAKKNAVKISLNDSPVGWASYVGTTDLAGGETTPPRPVGATHFFMNVKLDNTRVIRDLQKYLVEMKLRVLLN